MVEPSKLLTSCAHVVHFIPKDTTN